ncbi:MAG: hypothetical protein RLZZ298_280 [Pseudomonadota bacterium]|jgi:hypothetical protein
MKLWTTLLLALLAFSATADVYKCRQPNGSTEISSSPCTGGSSTVKTLADEVISPESRRQAERHVEQMRIDAERLEATRRADAALERQELEAQRQASGPSPSAIEDCLRTLDRLALEASRRKELEATCQSKGSVEPVYVPVPYYVGPTYVRPVHPAPPQTRPEPLPAPATPVRPRSPTGKINSAYTPPPGNFQPR